MGYIKAISPLDGRYFNKISGLSELVSEFGLIKYRLKVEIEWLKILFATPELGLPSLSGVELELLDSIIINFNEIECRRVKSIEEVTNHDVKALEYYIKEKVAHNAKLNKYKEFIHFACTSEDINNLSYALMLKDIKEIVLSKDLELISNKLLSLSKEYQNTSIMCRTHGQPATPSTMGKELYNVITMHTWLRILILIGRD
jgi:adenylosuccinate lyase